MDNIYLVVGFIAFWGVIAAIAFVLGTVALHLLLYFIRSLRIYHHPIVGGKVAGNDLPFTKLMKHTWNSAIYGEAENTTVGGYLFPLWSKSKEHSWYSIHDDDED